MDTVSPNRADTVFLNLSKDGHGAQALPTDLLPSLPLASQSTAFWPPVPVEVPPTPDPAGKFCPASVFTGQLRGLLEPRPLPLRRCLRHSSEHRAMVLLTPSSGPSRLQQSLRPAHTCGHPARPARRTHSPPQLSVNTPPAVPCASAAPGPQVARPPASHPPRPCPPRLQGSASSLTSSTRRTFLCVVATQAI